MSWSMQLKNKLLSIQSLLLSGLIWSFATVAHAEQAWKSEMTVDGIELFSRVSSDRPELFEYRAEGWIDADLSRAAGVFVNVDSAKEWLYKVTESSLVSRNLETAEQTFYLVQYVPVLKNRDIVMKAVMTQDPETLALRATINTVEDVLPPKKGMVRVQYYKGLLELIPSEDFKRTFVAFEVSVDPGGHIPVRLANIFMKTSPIKTVQSLRELDFNDDKYTPPCSDQFNYNGRPCKPQ